MNETTTETKVCLPRMQAASVDAWGQESGEPEVHRGGSCHGGVVQQVRLSGWSCCKWWWRWRSWRMRTRRRRSNQQWERRAGELPTHGSGSDDSLSFGLVCANFCARLRGGACIGTARRGVTNGQRDPNPNSASWLSGIQCPPSDTIRC